MTRQEFRNLQVGEKIWDNRHLTAELDLLPFTVTSKMKEDNREIPKSRDPMGEDSSNYRFRVKDKWGYLTWVYISNCSNYQEDPVDAYLKCLEA